MAKGLTAPAFIIDEKEGRINRVFKNVIMYALNFW